jgi:hypothetical protein
MDANFLALMPELAQTAFTSLRIALDPEAIKDKAFNLRADTNDFAQTAEAPSLYEGIVYTFVQLFLSRFSGVIVSSLTIASERRDESSSKRGLDGTATLQIASASHQADARQRPRPTREQSQKSAAKGEQQNESNT